MRNIWYQHPAKFEFSGKKVRAKFDNVQVQGKSRRSKGLAYLLDTPEHWQSWLERFCDIKERSSLERYLCTAGFPHLTKMPKTEELEEDEELLLGSAAFMRWILFLLDAVKRNSQKDIKLMCTPKRKAGFPSNKVILVPRCEVDFLHWSGFKKLASHDTSQIEFSINCSDEDLRRGTWSIPIAVARDYVIQSINKLVEGISPRMDKKFVPIFIPRTPYEAMCLSLLAQATGTGASKFCARPGCMSLLFEGTQNQSYRKHRIDKKYCSQKCRQYMYDEMKRQEEKRNGKKPKRREGEGRSL